MSSQAPRTDRRSALAAAAALLLPALGAGSLAAASDNQSTLEGAVERLRTAMANGDAKALDAVLHNQLTYSHSNGHLQSKSQVIEELGGASTFVSLTFTQQTVEIIQDVGVVRHIYDSLRNMPDGKTSTAHIAVLQAWLRTGGGWRLLARSSTPIKA